MGILSEFKEFAFKGNMLDTAAGIILGAAMGTVIASLVGDVIMPVVGLALGHSDFSNLLIPLGSGADGKPSGIMYGKFINALIAFTVVAWVMFMLLKSVAKAKALAEKPKPAAAPAAPPRQEVLLEQILGALKK